MKTIRKSSKIGGSSSIKKYSQKDIVNYLLPYIKEYKKNVIDVQKGLKEYGEFKDTNGGIVWSGTKSEGKIFHAYCYGDLIFEHEFKQGFFEDCIQTSKYENIKSARKNGWIIFQYKKDQKELVIDEFDCLKEIPICPSCKEKIINELNLKGEK